MVELYKENVCIGGSDRQFCLDLTEVSTSKPDVFEPFPVSEPKNEEICAKTDGFSAMRAAEDMGGLRLIVCDENRQCSVFRSDISADFWNEATKMIGHAPGSDYWANKKMPVGISDIGMAYYFITPDDKVYQYEFEKGTMQFLGDGSALLTKREGLLHKAKENMSQVLSARFDYRRKALEGKEDTAVGYADLGNIKFNYEDIDPLKVWTDHGLDLFTTPTMNVLDSSIDEWKIGFAAFMEEKNDPFLDECMSSNVFVLNAHATLGANGFFSDDLDGRQSLMLMGDGTFRALLSDRDFFNSILKHECMHWDFFKNGLRDEPGYLVGEAFLNVKRDLSNRYTESELEDFHTRTFNDWEDFIYIGEELRSYLSSRHRYFRSSLLTRMQRVIEYCPPDVAVYIFEWVKNVVKNDPAFLKNVSVSDRMHAEILLDKFILRAKYENRVVLWDVNIAGTIKMIDKEAQYPYYLVNLLDSYSRSHTFIDEFVWMGKHLIP